MFKKVFAGVLSVALCAAMAGCGATDTSADTTASAQATAEAPASSSEAQTTENAAAAPATALRVAGLKGPTTMGLVNLIEWTAQGATAESAAATECNMEFTMYGAADEIVPLLAKGELDAAAVPANLAATLYQKTNGALQVAAINTLGVLYVVETGDTVHTVADLAGQTIVTTGKGTTPEYVLRYLLTQNGLDPDTDVTILYTSEATEALAQVQAGDATIAMLPQPFVTGALSQVEGLRVALDMNAEWEAVAGSKLVTGVLVVQKTVSEAADSSQFDAFMQAYGESVTAANTDVETTAALCEKYGIVAKAPLAQKALPQCNIVLETGDEMKQDLQAYYQVLYDADPASVGGALPGDDFYCNYAG